MREMTFVVDDKPVDLAIPDWVNDLESFRRWCDDDDFPEEGRICYLHGRIWIDMSKEQLFSHNDAKSEISGVLRSIVRAGRRGRYFSDGAYLSNETADISNKPDGLFASTGALASERVRVVEGKTSGYVELEGTPDMVLEVVSDGSVEKDTVTLLAAYAAARIPEYWLVDARGREIRFDILTLTRGAYRAARKKDGWAYSPVFGHSFRLVAGLEDGYLAFTLEHRAGKP